MQHMLPKQEKEYIPEIWKGISNNFKEPNFTAVEVCFVFWSFVFIIFFKTTSMDNKPQRRIKLIDLQNYHFFDTINLATMV